MPGLWKRRAVLTRGREVNTNEKRRLMGKRIPRNTLKNGKQKRYIHFGGRTAFHDECGLQCARFSLAVLSRALSSVSILTASG